MASWVRGCRVTSANGSVAVTPAPGGGSNVQTNPAYTLTSLTPGTNLTVAAGSTPGPIAGSYVGNVTLNATGGSSAWVGTATSNLNMNGYNIQVTGAAGNIDLGGTGGAITSTASVGFTAGGGTGTLAVNASSQPTWAGNPLLVLTSGQSGSSRVNNGGTTVTLSNPSVTASTIVLISPINGAALGNYSISIFAGTSWTLSLSVPAVGNQNFNYFIPKY